MHRAFHPLHQIDGRQPADALFPVCLGKADINRVIFVQIGVFIHFTGEDELGGGINA